jgi:hypothetical protein
MFANVDSLLPEGPMRRLPIPNLIEPLEQRINLSLTVSTVLDSGPGSLRQAILDANANPGPDTIVFDASFYASPKTIIINSAPPQMAGVLTITGPGSSLLTVQRSASGAGISRQVFSSFASNLTMSGMTITGGSVSGAAGGGISILGVTPNATLDDIVITGNSSDGLAGGIYLGNDASLTIRNSIISKNTALSGGGIYFNNGGTLLMENTSVIGNIANAPSNASAGGLYFDAKVLTAPPDGYTPGTLVIRNCTFSGNTSTGIAGAIHISTLTGTLQLENSTFSGNSAVSGGAIALTSGAGSLLVQNCTITQNTASGTSATTGGGGIFRASILNNSVTIVNSIVSGNNNAGAPDIRTDAFTTTHVNFSAIGSNTGFTEAGDSGNNLPFGTNLKLDVLAGSGGLTRTHAILAGSPLINAGSNVAVPADLTTDQRGAGFPRINGGVVDIGAFETVSVGPTVSLPQFNYLSPPQSLQFTFSENVKASLNASNLVLKNLTTNSIIPTANISLNYDINNVATFTFPGYLYGALPDGNYGATLTAAGITDTSGHPLAADYTFDFYFLNGDANRDRSVGFADLVAVAQNYGATSGVNFAKGDFTYDGKVDFADLVIVAQKYGTSLPLPALPLPGALPDSVTFSVISVARPPVKLVAPVKRKIK